MTETITKDPKIVEEMDTVQEVTKRRPSTNQWVAVANRIKQNDIAMLAFYWVAFMVVVAIFHPLLMQADPTRVDPVGYDGANGGGARAYPNFKYPFGTSQKGYDSFSRVVAGSQTSILVGLLATLISLALGVLIGLVAGYYQGWVEEVLMRLTDLFLSVPFLIIALLLLSVIQQGGVEALKDLSHVSIITILIGVFGWAGLARLVTANVKQVSNLEYIHAVKIMGARDRRIIFSHILPNVLAPIIVVAALFVAGSILSEAGLAFLGFADPGNTLSWGVDVSINQDIFRQHPEQILIPGIAIFILVLAVNIFGDALRDALDPRLRQ